MARYSEFEKEQLIEVFRQMLDKGGDRFAYVLQEDNGTVREFKCHLKDWYIEDKIRI